MRMEKLVGERFKEKPSDSIVESHSLMLRGGYMKYVASGIFSMLPPLKRICMKIERILREEMDAIGVQEVTFPVVLPATLWEESGRYTSVGSELMRISDRNDSPMLLGMTHEEAAVHMARGYGQSYNKYPILIYQIQTKFRDEPRPRAGLIRVREFTMKDAYSFHTSQEDLERFYDECYKAYERIFARAGVPEVISVASDTGMMGGKLAHEFQLLTPAGEDSIVICKSCGYKANMEAAECIIPDKTSYGEEDLKLVSTPNTATIEEVCRFFNAPVQQTCKAVAYLKLQSGGGYAVVFLRGDLDVNEVKVKKLLGTDVVPAEIDDTDGLFAGSIGPVNLDARVTVLFDRSLENTGSLICGGNVKEHHYTGLNIERDCPGTVFHDLAKARNGDICPDCKKPGISIERGIEVGNIFQLGTKYTETMGMQYTDENGDLKYPIMGSYGIGVGRLAASICEVRHDEYGPIWPITVAPWQVHICCLRAIEDEVRGCGETLYSELQKQGVEVIYDDRSVSAGVMFSDADLLGVPVRVVVSPRNLKEGKVELSTRDKSVSEKVDASQAPSKIRELVQRLMDETEQKVSG